MKDNVTAVHLNKPSLFIKISAVHTLTTVQTFSHEMGSIGHMIHTHTHTFDLWLGMCKFKAWLQYCQCSFRNDAKLDKQWYEAPTETNKWHSPTGLTRSCAESNSFIFTLFKVKIMEVQNSKSVHLPKTWYSMSAKLLTNQPKTKKCTPGSKTSLVSRSFITKTWGR